MSELFDENNEITQNQAENTSNAMSLDGRKNQLEDKVKQEMNQLDRGAVSEDEKFSGVRLSSPFEVKNEVSEKSPYNAEVKVAGDNQNVTQSNQNAVSTAENAVNQMNNPYAYSQNQNYQANNQQPSVYGSPYAGYTTDYTNGAPYYMAKPKKKTNSGLKAFLIIMSSLTAIFTVGFIAECVVSSESGEGGFASFLEEYENYGQFEEYEEDEETDTETDSDSVTVWDFWSFEEEDEQSDVDTDNNEKRPSNNDIQSAPDKDSVINENAANIKIVDQPKDIDSAEYTARNAYKKIEASVVSIIIYEGRLGNDEDMVGEGSGIIITEDGYIVTNSHVINDRKGVSVEVRTFDDTSYEAVIVGYDSRTDLAVLKIDGDNFTSAEFVNSDQVEVGQDALAVGSPGGIEYSSTLTRGAVSAINRTLSDNTLVSYIQTDAAINPGNSGGPLLNSAGQVMGINTIKIVDTEYEGMGFAIPSNKVVEIVNDLISKGYVSNRVRIGIVGTVVGEEYSYYGFDFENNLPNGIRITDFAEESPFEGTEAEVGDIITALNGEKIEDFTQLYSELDKYQPGDEVTVTLYREGSKDNTIEVEIVLVADNGETQQE